MSIVTIINQIIFYTYLSLAIATPIIFSTHNTELFEIPKMILVYLGAIIVLSLTLVKLTLQYSPRRSSGEAGPHFEVLTKLPVTCYLLLVTLSVFVLVQALSTVFSIDKFTSVFGYPSRLNGGLLSQIAYFILFAGIIINLTAVMAKKLLVAIVIAAAAVSLWGIPSHFGWDPSCLVMNGNPTTEGCWQKEFKPQLRIFSTLGQPNWLASYLVLIVPIALALAISSAKTGTRIIFLSALFLILTAFLFTGSRAGAIGLGVAILVFILLLGINAIKRNIKTIGPILAGFLVLTAVFGIGLFLRIDDTFKIRLVVWRGAIEVTKHWPLLGSGPETFAYAYYLYRPLEANQTAEWNFFYNKAHNEFLNYLATTGILGLGLYLVFLGTAIFALTKHQRSQPATSYLLPATISSLIGYQATIFFGFSVVTTQMVMFTMIATGYQMVETGDKRQEIRNKRQVTARQWLALALVGIFTTYSLVFIGRIFLADILQKRDNYLTAIDVFPARNPFYLADAAQVYATISLVEDPAKITLAQQLAQEAESLSGQNLITQRKITQAYLLLAEVDGNYRLQSIETARKLITLAPTDPQSYLSLARAQAAADQKEEAIKSVETALYLKPDYQEAKELLEQIQKNELK